MPGDPRQGYRAPVRGRVVLDLQALQSPSYRERGIARYARDFALALEQRHPDVVGQIAVRADLPAPDGVDALVAAGKVTTTPDWRSAAVLHAMSPFDLDVPVGRIVPRAASAAGLRTVATVYDLIPDLAPEVYLGDPGTRRRYRARRELVRLADHVVTLSQTAADDVCRRLGTPRDAVTVVGATCSDRFRPDPVGPGAARARARAALPHLGERTVVYNGAIEPRKNVEGLLEAFAALPRRLLDDVQLVLVCRLAPLERNHLEVRARQLGVADRVVLTGAVTDEVLVDLYRSASLAAVPSLLEGYGLPAAEAMACGCPVIASAGTSLAELVHPDATFDPRSKTAITAALQQALTDPELRARLLAWSQAFSPSWEPVVDRAADVYERMAGRPRHGWPARPRLALLTPWPPAPSGVADYSARLAAALADHVDVDVYEDGDHPHDRATSAAAFDVVQRARGGYDATVACLGNSEFHAGALLALRRARPHEPAPAVLAHEVELRGLYRHAEPRGAAPEGVEAAAAAMYPGLSDDERAARPMAREAISRSSAFLVTNRHAAELARLEAGPGDGAKVAVVGFGFPDPGPPRAGVAPALLASFGVVHPVKQPDLLVGAVAQLRTALDVRLALVGPVSDGERRRLEELAGELGVTDALTITGRVDREAYDRWLASATVAVQLRAASNGEMSAATADCVAGGVPLVVTEIGGAADLPPWVRKVSTGIDADDLARVLRSCLTDGRWRDEAAVEGRRWAAEHDFGWAALELLAAVGLTAAARVDGP